MMSVEILEVKIIHTEIRLHSHNGTCVRNDFRLEFATIQIHIKISQIYYTPK